MSALESALDFLLSHTLDYEIAKAYALMVGYDAVYKDFYTDFDVIHIEEEFRFPLLNPVTNAASKTFDEGGKIDLVLRRRSNGQLVIVEHKTTGDSIQAGSNYWDRLTMDTQCSKYIIAMMERGHEVGSLIYDVVRKPSSRPRQIPSTDEDGVKIVLDGHGNRVKTKDGKKWRESADEKLGYVLQSVQETPEQYFERLKTEILADLSAHYAQRQVPRLDADLLEYMSDAWSVSQQILHYRRAKIWPRNPSACTMFGTCEFFDLCTGRASIDGIRFVQSAKHAELSMEEGSKELLTNSRMTALRKCARYHFHRYEEPIRPVKEESEALRFGTLVHKAFEAYFGAMKVS